MILLVDIGNTRIKWASLTESGLGAQQAAAHANWNRAHIDSNLLAHVEKPSRVLVSNVGGAIADELSKAVRDKWAVSVELVGSTRSAGGIRNAYTTPEQLGVDRWLAMIGAHALISGPLCIASVGTAMTVDSIDASGNHLGGIIVPGPELAVASLFKHTSDLAARAQSGIVKPTMFADNTLGAIQQGVANMLAAVVEKSFLELRGRLPAEPVLVLTGGAAERISPAFTIGFRTVPDLVLRGLAVIARG